MISRMPLPLPVIDRINMEQVIETLRSQYNTIRWLIDRWDNIEFKTLDLDIGDLRNEIELMGDRLNAQDEIISSQNKKIITLQKQLNQMKGKVYHGKSSKHKH